MSKLDDLRTVGDLANYLMVRDADKCAHIAEAMLMGLTISNLNNGERIFAAGLFLKLLFRSAARRLEEIIQEADNTLGIEGEEEAKEDFPLFLMDAISSIALSYEPGEGEQ